MSEQTVTIKPPAFKTAAFKIVGTAPLVVNKFPAKAREMMRAKQAAGTQGKKGSAREAKDFEACYQAANGDGYRRTADVMTDEELRSNLLSEARDDMETFKTKYRRLHELSAVFEAMEAATKAAV